MLIEIIISILVIALLVIPFIFPEDNTSEHIAKIVEDMQDD